MKVLVTGGAGFIGHHVVAALLRTDHEVVSLDRLDTSGTLCRLAEVCNELPDAAHRLRTVWHDLRAPINDHVAARIGQPAVVLHLAAATHVDRSISDPLSFVYDNVVGTANLLDYVRLRLGNPLVVVFSTDEVFGPAAGGVAFKEDDRYHCGNPYAATKAGAEQLALSYHNTYGMRVIVTHTMNVIGKRQAPEKFVPLVVKSVINNDLVRIHADPTRTHPGSRFYINASDVAEAVLFLMKEGADGVMYNIVGSREMDNLELAQTIAKSIGGELRYELVDFHSSRPGHDLRYALDGSRLASLGWKPDPDIHNTIKSIARWTAQNPRWLA